MLRHEGVYAEEKKTEEEPKAEKDLRKSEQKFRGFFERANECMVYLDRSGKILDVNRKALEVFGGSREELLGKHFTKVGVFSLKDIPSYMSAFAEALGGKQVTRNVCIKNKQGREMHLELSGSLMKIQNEPVGLFIIARDITERKRVEEEMHKSEAKNRALMSAIPDLMLQISKDGTFLDFKQAKDFPTAVPPSEFLGKNIREVMPTELAELTMHYIKRALQTQDTQIFEYQLPVPLPNGNINNYEARIVVSGKDEVLALVRDITKRKQMEERIAYLASIVDNAKVAIATVNMNGTVTYCNKATEEMLGWTSKEMIGKPMARFCLNAGKQIEATGKEGFCLDQELEYVKKDGSTLLCSTSTFLMKDNDGNPIGVGGIAIDITERKQIEEKLRFLKEFNERIVNSIGDALLVIDPNDYTIISANESASKQLKLRKEDLIGKTCYETTHHSSTPCKPPHHICPIREMLKTGKAVTVEHTHFDKDNKEIFVEVSARPVRNQEGKIVHFVHLARDITERKRAEEMLRESQEKLQGIFSTMTDGITLVGLDGRILDCNDAVLRLHGISRDEYVGRNVFDLVAPEDRQRAIQGASEVLEKGFIRNVVKALRKEGGTFDAEIDVSLLRNASGKPTAFLGVTRDITERKKMEEKLRQYSEYLGELVQKRTDELLESEKRYSVLVEEASDGVFIGQDEQVVFANKRGAEIFGYSRDELIGLPFEKLVDEKYLQLVKERYKRRLGGEKVPSTYEIEVIAKTGERVPVEISGTLIHYQDRPADLVIMRDIRERKRMEEQRSRLEKLATIGELATMVGHDLRNPLQSIENAAYYLNNEMQCLQTSAKGKEMLQVINDSINYADRIIRDLQDFSTTKAPTLEKTDINTMIKETLSQVQLSTNIELRTELGYLPEIKVDKDQMKRVFLNLTTNGLQAMENEGTLTVATKKTEGFVEVSFKDTGIGISKENMEKLFTPFFTTRAKGMGIGLPICKKFVENHGGSIKVESEVGKGTTFTVKLPILPNNGGEKT